MPEVPEHGCGPDRGPAPVVSLDVHGPPVDDAGARNGQP